MIRLLFFIMLACALALAAHWFAQEPGELIAHWRDYEIRTSVSVAILFLIVSALTLFLILEIIHGLLRWPARISGQRQRRRQALGLDAAANALIALNAHDHRVAKTCALKARRCLGNIPLTKFLFTELQKIENVSAPARITFDATER